MEAEDLPVVTITRCRIPDYADKLEKLGFTQVESGQSGRFKYAVPSQFNVLLERPRYDLETVRVFYGDLELLNVSGKTACYDYSMTLFLNEDNIAKYHTGEVSNEPGVEYDAACKHALKVAKAETKRQRNLAATDPAAYQNEGLIALANIANENGSDYTLM
jgi:hypothetical protein